MLLHADIKEKGILHKTLFRNLQFTIEPGSRTGLIGRNGTGKTTLFRMLAGVDQEYLGEVNQIRDLRIAVSEQEHFLAADQRPLDYILDQVPQYRALHAIIETYPQHMGSDLAKIHTYSEALAVYGEKGYFNLEGQIEEQLLGFGITERYLQENLSQLSGGQRRFVELVRMQFSGADLILLDEPTNHLDYLGKEQFLKWLNQLEQATVIISHDRDVLEKVERIIEIRDQKAFIYPGNYAAYLKQNSSRTVSEITSYENSLKELATLHKQIQGVRARKAGGGDNAMKILEERLIRQYETIESKLEKPSFWIDQESMSTLDDKVVERYDRYKSKNIHISKQQPRSLYGHVLLEAEKLSLGFVQPLFSPLSFKLQEGDRLHLKGRNGAGKSTLVGFILDMVAGRTPKATVYSGSLTPYKNLKIGLYEQELAPSYLDMTLSSAVEHIYLQSQQAKSPQEIKAVLSRYLFDPQLDLELKVSSLSGGQKARLQIIRMLSADPNLLILDEPTNHLDLPSIEELEKALQNYQGAILYISHDSYFVESLGGTTLSIGI